MDHAASEPFFTRKPTMSSSSRTLVIAHRGHSRAFPENTIAAFDGALAAGADAIELDLQLSRDGVPVAYHDRTLHRIDGSRRRIANLTVAELSGMDFGSWFDRRFHGERPPTLAKILTRYAHDMLLMLELKVDPARDDASTSGALARSVVDHVVQRGLHDRVFILSFDRRALDQARACNRKLRYIQTVGRRPPTATILRAIEPLHGLCLPGRELDQRLADAIHRAGKSVYTYRCDTERVANHVLRCGTDGLMADDPKWLRAHLAHGSPALMP